MSDDAQPSPRRARLLWTLLGAMVLVGLVPLVVSHYFLIGINRDSLETLEKKYLTRSAVGISTDIQNLLASNTQQLTKIAGSMRVMQKALPAGHRSVHLRGADRNGSPTTSRPTATSSRCASSIATGKGAEAEAGAARSRRSRRRWTSPCEAALKGQPYTGTFQYVTVAQPAGGRHRRAGRRRRHDHRHRRRPGQPAPHQPIASATKGKGDVTAFLVDRNGNVLIHSEPAIDVQRPDFSHLKIVQEFTKAPVRLTESVRRQARRRAHHDARHRRAGRRGPTGASSCRSRRERAYASVDKMVRATIEWVSIALAPGHHRRDRLRVRHRPSDPRARRAHARDRATATTSSASS